jgi:hypothetical protein
VHAGDCGGAHSYSQSSELQAAGTELAFLDGADFDALVEDITAGVEPTFTPFRGDDPLAFVVSASLHRRHLSKSPRESPRSADAASHLVS